MRLPDDLNTVIRLRFADPRLAELDIRIRRSFGLVDSGADLSTIDAAAVQAGTPRPEDMAKVRQLVDDLAAALVSWNLDDDQGQRLPTDRETVRGLDIMVVLLLAAAFMAAITELRREIAALASQLSEGDLPMAPIDAEASAAAVQ